MSIQRRPLSSLHQLITLIARKANSRRARGLKAYHAIGRLVNRWPADYGSDRFGSLAECLAEHHVAGLDTSTLRKCHRFAQRIDAKQLKILITAKVSWRNASRLASRQFSDQQMGKMILDLVKKADAGKELGRKLSKTAGPKSLASARAIEAAHQRAISAIEQLLETRALKELSDDLRIRIDSMLKSIGKRANGKSSPSDLWG